MSLQTYYPEMSQPKPQHVDGSVMLSHYGKHYYIRTCLELKGRGIELMESEELVNGAVTVSKHRYKVTLKAFDKLCGKYDFSAQLLLD